MFNGRILILFLVLLPLVLSNDYCSRSLCRNGGHHIACNNSGHFASICHSPKIIPMTPAFRNQILHKHNSLRNQIARGFAGFPSAERMATMVWNDELAHLAELNVKQCQMRHDQCRNTRSFPYSGQNLAMYMWYGFVKTVPQLIEHDIQGWFDEYKYTPRNIVAKYTSPKNGKMIGHFTAMVQDKSTHVGCAILQHKLNQFTQHFLACNYAFTNMLNSPVYRQGRTASRCTTGTNRLYPSLCSTRERYRY